MVTGAVLKLLIQHPQDETTLVNSISRTLEIEPDHSLSLFVKQSLVRLSGLGLVECDK